MNAFPWTCAQVLQAVDSLGFTVFRDPKGYDLNIVGIRTASVEANRFDDWLTVSHLYGGIWRFYAFACTTDPGTYWLKNPERAEGTAILKPGQYRSCFKLGKHLGRYDALVQQGAVTVYRDANRDGKIDIAGAKEQTGMFGINIHHAHTDRLSNAVERWSAGCTVVQDYDEFSFFMRLIQRALHFGWPNSFTYTLITEAQLDNAR